jgi:hypothetical protein
MRFYHDPVLTSELGAAPWLALTIRSNVELAAPDAGISWPSTPCSMTLRRAVSGKNAPQFSMCRHVRRIGVGIAGPQVVTDGIEPVLGNTRQVQTLEFFATAST